MTYRQAAALGAVGGAAFAASVAAFHVARATYAISRAGRWYQLKHL